MSQEQPEQPHSPEELEAMRRERLIEFRDKVAKMSPEEVDRIIEKLLDLGYDINEYPGQTRERAAQLQRGEVEQDPDEEDPLGDYITRLIADLGKD